MATETNPLGSFVTAFQNARRGAQQYDQQQIANQLTEQLRQVQLLTAQRQLQEAMKSPEQKANEAAQLKYISDVINNNEAVPTVPGFEGVPIGLPGATNETALQVGARQALSKTPTQINQPSLSNLIAQQITPSSGPEQPTLPVGSQFGKINPTALSDAMSNITAGNLPTANIEVPTIAPAPFVAPSAALRGYETPVPGISSFNRSIPQGRDIQLQKLNDEMTLANAKFDMTPHPILATDLTTGETGNQYLNKDNPNLRPGTIPSSQIAYTGQTGAPVKTKSDVQTEQFGQKMDAAQQKQAASDSKAWDTLLKSGNPLTAPSRSVLGVVGTADLKVNRALKILDKPLITKQELGSVVGDLSSIIQSGSPTKYGMAEQDYNTLESKAANWMQYLTGTPTDAVPDEIKKVIKDDLLGIKQQNKDVINQQLNIIEQTHPDMIKKKQKEWDDFRSKLQEGVVGAPTGSPKIGEVKTFPNGNKATWNGTGWFVP